MRYRGVGQRKRRQKGEKTGMNWFRRLIVAAIESFPIDQGRKERLRRKLLNMKSGRE